MSTLLVKNISTLITNDKELGDFKDGAVYVENNEIRQVGYTKDLPKTADVVIDLLGGKPHIFDLHRILSNQTA